MAWFTPRPDPVIRDGQVQRILDASSEWLDAFRSEKILGGGDLARLERCTATIAAVGRASSHAEKLVAREHQRREGRQGRGPLELPDIGT